MGTLKLTEITPDNVGDACKLEVEPHQREHVAPVAWSLAEAYAQPEIAWPRLLFDGDAPVAFVMGGFDPAAPVEFFRCGVWRLNVAAGRQGRGYGRYLVEAVLAEARQRGETRAFVLWVPGEDGPEQFYLRLGFRKTGEVFHGQVVGVLDL